MDGSIWMDGWMRMDGYGWIDMGVCIWMDGYGWIDKDGWMHGY